jgi:hypothetical protein
MRGYQRTHRGEHLPSAFLWPFMHLRSMVPLGMAGPSVGAGLAVARRQRLVRRLDGVFQPDQRVDSAGPSWPPGMEVV